MKKMKRGFSLLLSAALVLGMVPVQGFAADCPHNLTYSAEGTCITATCGNEGCTYKETATLELDKEASLAYTGEEVKPLKVVYSAGWQDVRPEITYVNNIEVTELQEAAAEPVMEEPPEEEKSQPLSEDTVPESETEPADTKEQDPQEEKAEEPKIPTGTLTIGNVFVTQTFAIAEKETLIVTATATVTYGDPAPQYTPVYKNDKGEVVQVVLDGEPEMTSGYIQGDAAGDYTIEVNTDKLTSDQYEFVPEKGSLTVARRKLTVALDSAECTYDGNEHTPKVIVDNLVGTDVVEAVYESVTAKNAGTYEITVSEIKGEEEVLKNYELPAEKKLTFTVNPRVVEFKLDKAEYVYNGQPQTPVVTIGNLVGGDQLELDYDPVTGEEPDEYTITIKGFKPVEGYEDVKDNYSLTKKEVKFTIQKGTQAAPTTVEAEPESVRGKANGRITGVDNTMEYGAKPAEGEVAYKKIRGEEITDLPAGIYCVRYAETAEKAASDPVEVTVDAGAPLTVTLPASQKGYILTADKTEAGWEESVTLTFTIATGYVRTKDFAVKVDGETVKLEKDGKCTISKLQENAVVTVEGVEPILTMELMGTKYYAVEEKITFDLYSNTTQTLTIISGLASDTIYYTETTAKTDPEKIADAKWIEYDEPVTIAKNDRKAVFYAKVEDGSNVYYASTNGVVFDTIAPVIKVNGAVATTGKSYYTTQLVTATDTNLKEVRLNGIAKEQPISLAGNTEETYIVRAEDAAGNQNHITVKMYPIATLKESAEGLNSVDSISTTNATKEEKDALNEIKTNKAAYLVILQIQALPDAEDIKPYNEDHRDAYKAVQEAYTALTDTQKKLISETDTDHLEDVKEALAYKIISDEDDLQWEKKSKVDLVVKVNGPDARFKELQIGGKAVATTKYTHKEDTYGTKITIDEAYLETLTTGKKTIKVVYDDGSTDGKDQIEILKAGSTNPKTGDEGILFWMTASVLSLACLAAAAIPGRKRKFQA